MQQLGNVYPPPTPLVGRDVPWVPFFCSVFVTISMGLCRSDPTENDSVEGLRPNARGPGLVTFGVSVYVIFICQFSNPTSLRL